MLRSNIWWNDIVLKSFTPKDWLENFCMSKQTFSWTTSHTLERATPNRWPIVLYSVGVAKHHNAIATLFSRDIDWHMTGSCLCKADIHKYEVCAAIVQQLLKVYIKFPEGEELDRVVLGFKKNLPFVNVLGQLMAVTSLFAVLLVTTLTFTIGRVGIQ